MSTVRREIEELEELLRLAELGPDPSFFEKAIAGDAVILSEDGAAMPKSRIVAAHQPGAVPKFTRVEMTNMEIVDHGSVAVVTCQGQFESEQFTGTLKFMRVWLKREQGWQIVAASVMR